MNSHTDVTVGKELVYALNSDGMYVHIDDVENGLNCNCTCPACGGQLIAKNGGEKIKHYFAHYNKAECDYIRQTNIHCLAEEIFLTKKELFLPSDSMISGNLVSIFDQSSYRLPISSVVLEKRVSDFIPDIIVTSGDLTIFVEIFVTHIVSEEKKNKIAVLGNCIAIEIDLSDKAHDSLTKEQLGKLLDEPQRIKWLYNPETEELHKNFELYKKHHKLPEYETVVRNCPQRFFGVTCDNCVCCVGRTKSEIQCNYDFVYSDKCNSVPYPRFAFIPGKTGLKKAMPPNAIEYIKRQYGLR